MASSTEQKPVDLSGYMTRSPNGTIDVQASHLKFTQDVAHLVAMEKTDNEVIAKAVEKAFRDQNVTGLGMNAILHYAMENLDVDASNFNTIRERVATFVRSNTKAYKVSKGKGGGVQWLQGDDSKDSNHAMTLPPSSGSIRPRALA